MLGHELPLRKNSIVLGQLGHAIGLVVRVDLPADLLDRGKVGVSHPTDMIFTSVVIHRLGSNLVRATLILGCGSQRHKA